MAAVAPGFPRERPSLMWWRCRIRGFIFGTAIAGLGLGSGPPQTRQVALRSAKSRTPSSTAKTLEAAADAFTQRRVLLADDVLATGGTFVPPLRWREQQQGVVKATSCWKSPFWKAGSCLPPCGSKASSAK